MSHNDVTANNERQGPRQTLSGLRTWKHVSLKPQATNYWYQSSYPVASATPEKRPAKKAKQQQQHAPREQPEPTAEPTKSPSTTTRPVDDTDVPAKQHVAHGSQAQAGSLKAVLLLGGLRELFGGMHDDLGTVLQSGGISNEMIDQLKDVSTAIGLVVEELNNCRAPCCELHGDSGEKCSCK